MKAKTVLSLALFFLVPLVSVYSQNSSTVNPKKLEKHVSFETKEQYLELLNKKYDIGKEEVHYIPKTQADSIPIPFTTKISDLKFAVSNFIFVKNKHVISFEELTNSLCSTDRVLNGLNLDMIDTKLAKSPEYANFVFKNMATDEVVMPQKDEIVAVFYYTYLDKKWMGRMKDRKLIAERLGIRTFVVSKDGYDLKSVDDINKEKINMIREFSIF